MRSSALDRVALLDNTAACDFYWRRGGRRSPAPHKIGGAAAGEGRLHLALNSLQNKQIACAHCCARARSFLMEALGSIQET